MDRRARTFLVLVVALATASIAAFSIYRVIERMPVREVEVANYQVIVASKPLALGASLTRDDVYRRLLLESDIPLAIAPQERGMLAKMRWLRRIAHPVSAILKDSFGFPASEEPHVIAVQEAGRLVRPIAIQQ